MTTPQNFVVNFPTGGYFSTIANPDPSKHWQYIDVGRGESLITIADDHGNGVAIAVTPAQLIAIAKSLTAAMLASTTPPPAIDVAELTYSLLWWLFRDGPEAPHASVAVIDLEETQTAELARRGWLPARHGGGAVVVMVEPRRAP